MVTKEELEKYQRAYSQGRPLITDEEYDRLLEEYVRANGENARPFNRQKQSGNVNDIVGTLPKVYGVTTAMRDNQKTYQDWAVKREASHHVIVQPKFDGCSVAVDLQTGRFFTRGDYDNGESVDVTDLFVHALPTIKQSYALPGTTAMKFEAILSHEKFHELQLNLKYLRPRDVVAATITSRNVELARHITLVPLRGYRNGEMYIPFPLQTLSITKETDSYEAIQSFISGILENGATQVVHGYEGYDQTFSIDGVVVSVIASQLHINDYPSITIVDPAQEIAIKILYNVQNTKLKYVDYQFGKQGRITPVAILEPVMFNNITVDHVTLSTLQRVVDMNLKMNDTVRVMYNIVPYLIDSLHDGDIPVQVPTTCPICGEKLDYITLKQVRCSNPNCKGLRLGAIIRHAEKMKMVGLSTGVITKLYDNEFVTRIADLYDLRKWDDCIPQTPGFGYQSYDNMIASVDKALTEVTLPRFLGALPINDTSESTWKQIIDVMGEREVYDSLRDGTFVERVMNVGYIPNVGEMKLRKIIDGIIRMGDELPELMEIIKDSPWETDPNQKNKKPKLALSGTRDADFIQAMEESGFEVTDKLTKDCIGLVVPNANFTSAKTAKAKEWGIEIYELSRAKYYFTKPF